VIDGTFVFVPGVGPSRERELYRLGIRSWDEFPAEGLVLSKVLDARIRAGIAEWRPLVINAEWERIAARLPVREHWRLYPHVEKDVTFLDIETTASGSVTVIGLFDEELGPRLYVRGHNLGDFVHERPRALMTFNGGSFDLPVLQKTFPGWTPPLHIDMRTVFRQLRERGGLKAIEDRLGIGRPDHLKGVGGADAVMLWQRFRYSRDLRALSHLLEYNLYDVVQLKSLAEIACERLARRWNREWRPRKRFERGDVLLDISRAVQSVVSVAGRIDPDEFHAEERRAIRSAGW
jgi:hypothetical protein